MNSSKLWSALVVCCIACGSSFHSSDASTGGDGSGNSTSIGGDASTGGTMSSGGTTSSAGNSGRGGGSNQAGSTSSGGDVSSGGDTSSGGVVNVAGDVGIAGANSGGGVVGSAGSNPTGGSAGSSSTGGGTSGSNCAKLWTAYTDLVAKSVVCDVGSTVECASGTGIVNECKCPVAVNHNSSYLPAAKKALQNWQDAGCTFKSCACLAMGTTVCASDVSRMTYTCQTSGSIIQQ